MIQLEETPMTVSRPVFALAIATAALGGIWLSVHGALHAQNPLADAPSTRPANIADAMFRPIRLPFGKETSLEEVVVYLRAELKANIVLDLAALARHELKPSSKVRLDLEDVRLKTGLKLLLDQVGLTTKIVPEDNLLVITDKLESDETIVRVLDEIKALHRDLHGLQDDVRDIRAMLETPAEAEEPVGKIRNPTIIEEMPAEGPPSKPDVKTKKDATTRTRPGI
jgi:hypothetical protein